MSRRVLVLISVLALLAATMSTASAHPWEVTDIFDQGETSGVPYAEDGAKIRRVADGLIASVTMATPEPGDYEYPLAGPGSTSSGVAGHPEAFSLWVFIFFNPEACVDGCDGPDLQNNENVIAGAFNAGGHLAAGPKLTITGRITEQKPVFGGPNAETLSEALAAGHDLADAEIHLAVAPHGDLDPQLLPAQITTPAGNANFWWVALYK